MEKQYERFYKWSMLIEDLDAESDTCFFEFEKTFLTVGIRTRVKKNETSGYSLWVPAKDYEYAHAFYTGEVKEIITNHHEIYHVFDKDMTFNNKALYVNKFAGLVKNHKWKYYVTIGILLLMMFLIVKFVKIP